MFRNAQLDRIEKKLARIDERISAIIEADIARNEKPVSPAKAPKRKYIKSGKYAKKVTTKKK